MPDTHYYIGLMSGTSADAIDAALVDFSNEPVLVGHFTEPLPTDLRQQIHQLSLPGDNEIDRMGDLDRRLGSLFAKAAMDLLDKTGLEANQIRAIGSHGQTIRHRPPQPSSRGFTLQIGDPNLIAEITGITTVADFRRRDMAAGGQGAPLVPAFHRAVFHSPEVGRAIVNIGGIANITWLPAEGDVIGFDTGPGNGLMDSWINLHQGHRYDRDGQWGDAGQVDGNFLATLLDDPFFRSPPPKSTGREAFNLDWLQSNLARLAVPIAAIDVQATLRELTARSIAQDIQRLGGESAAEVYICGGGAYNQSLMKSLRQHLPQHTIDTTSTLGVDPQWVEAMAFAWLAKQTLNRKSGNLCSVTGAKAEVILGGVYFA